MAINGTTNPEITEAYNAIEAIDSFEQLAEQHTLADCLQGLKKLAYQRIHNPAYNKKKRALMALLMKKLDSGEISYDEIDEA